MFEVKSKLSFKVKIFSFCKLFTPEQEENKIVLSPEELKKQVTDNFNKNIKQVTDLGRKMQKMARLDSPLNTIPANPEARKRIVVE